ncbi:NTP transferase domain-containing protein [Myxococcota bacterium]|nr:NTP transferase domain-containing protein [Myxococcota bacterium]
MGQPKALLRLVDGRTLLRAWLDALATVAPRRIVVVGAVVDPLLNELQAGEEAVHNPRWAETGPAESLHLGALALPDDTPWALVTPVDVPPCALHELARLCEAPVPAVLSHDGQPGHPVRLGPAELAAIRRAPPVGGLRSLLHAATLIPSARPDALLNLNTPEEWAAWRGEDRR